MKVSATGLKWLLRFYPPLFFQRIWVQHIGKDFKSAQVKLNRSLFNRNYNASIFGGTIYAATDAFYPVLFHQLFTHQGYRIIVWLKAATIQYIKPGMTDLYFEIILTDDDIATAKKILDTGGKFVHTYLVELYNKQGELCAAVSSEVYIRNLDIARE